MSQPTEEGIHKRLFQYFYFLMEQKMDLHMAEEGNAWVDEDEEELDKKLFAAVEEYKKTKDLQQLEDIANSCATRRVRGLLGRK